jgi:hypothetical protein
VVARLVSTVGAGLSSLPEPVTVSEVSDCGIDSHFGQAGSADYRTRPLNRCMTVHTSSAEPVKTELQYACAMASSPHVLGVAGGFVG